MPVLELHCDKVGLSMEIRQSINTSHNLIMIIVHIVWAHCYYLCTLFTLEQFGVIEQQVQSPKH